MTKESNQSLRLSIHQTFIRLARWWLSLNHRFFLCLRNKRKWKWREQTNPQEVEKLKHIIGIAQEKILRITLLSLGRNYSLLPSQGEQDSQTFILPFLCSFPTFSSTRSPVFYVSLISKAVWLQHFNQAVIRQGRKGGVDRGSGKLIFTPRRLRELVDKAKSGHFFPWPAPVSHRCMSLQPNELWTGGGQ